MVKFVLSTIDTELDEDFYESREGFSRRIFNFMRDLSLRLSELDVSFAVYRPSSILRRTERRKLEERIADSDIIFHNKSAMEEVPDSRMRLLDTIDGVIHNEHRDKSHTTESRDKYQMSKAMEAVGVPIPRTMPVKEYLDSERELPVVLKKNKGTLGEEVYYIERQGLIEKFFKEETYSKTPGRTPRKRRYLVQQFIRVPGGFFNHYRVFTVGGEILGCVLNIRGTIKELEDRARESNTLDEIFYNLRSYPIASNVARGGRQIPISHKPGGETYFSDREILEAHGIDPDNVAIPEPLKQYAQFVGKELKKQGFVFSGQDWINDEHGNYYYLQANPFPGLDIFNALFFDGKGSCAEYRDLAIGKIAEAIKRYNPQNPN